MANVTKTDKVPVMQEEHQGVQEQPKADPMQEMMAQLLRMQNDLTERFRILEEREAAVAKKESRQEPEPRIGDIVTSKAWEPENAREIFLPYATQGEEQFIMVGVNGMKYQVPRGVPVKVPLPLYERIMIMQDAQARTARYRNSLPNEAAPAQAVRVG